VSSTTTHGTPSTARVTSSGDGTARHGIRDEVVAVGLLADAGDVEAAGACLARVGDDRAVDRRACRVDVGGCDDGTPLTAWATSARVRAIIGWPSMLRGRAPGRARPGRRRGARPRDLLAGLVALADDGDRGRTALDHTAATASRIASRRSPTSSTRMPCRRRHAPLTPSRRAVRIDARVLRARVVVGDDHEVGDLGSGGPHGVALVAVAVTPGAGDDDQGARGARAQRVRAARIASGVWA
jgi:hypothetical protein